jgi:hypothetical protein
MRQRHAAQLEGAGHPVSPVFDQGGVRVSLRGQQWAVQLFEQGLDLVVVQVSQPGLQAGFDRTSLWSASSWA